MYESFVINGLLFMYFKLINVYLIIKELRFQPKISSNFFKDRFALPLNIILLLMALYRFGVFCFLFFPNPNNHLLPKSQSETEDARRGGAEARGSWTSATTGGRSTVAEDARCGGDGHR
jgi:hypothetical protein